MPTKNSIKQFIENGHYHIYNRGVEKRNIFLDKQDHSVFLGYLKYYLDPHSSPGSDPHPMSKEVDLLAFCLMPNHFHLLIKQTSIDGMTKLLRAISTKYVMYFNKKYERVGTLFQGKYKAALVTDDSYLLHLSRYIHLNPYPGSDPKHYNYSSYNYYLGRKSGSWIKTEAILDYFKTENKTRPKHHLSYEAFVEDYRIGFEELGELTLEPSEPRVGP